MILTSSTAFFLNGNVNLSLGVFFVKGGFILCASAFFMALLISTRYNLTIREIKARLALKLSEEEVQKQYEEIRLKNQEILAQDEEIKGINENLEAIVHERTQEIENKNKVLEEYAFINAHQLRSPVASVLGLINLIDKTPLTEEGREIVDHLRKSSNRLDYVVRSITKAIEAGEKINIDDF
jgi:signal transduction histidine kinase